MSTLLQQYPVLQRRRAHASRSVLIVLKCLYHVAAATYELKFAGGVYRVSKIQGFD